MNFIKNITENAVKLGNKVKFKAIQKEPELWFIGGSVFLVLAIFESAKAGKRYDEILADHKKELDKQDEAEKEVDEGKSDKTYSDEQRVGDRISTSIQTGVKIAKAAGPTVGLALASLACFGKSYGVLKGRYISMAAAYYGVLNDKLHLEDMIRKDGGQEKLDKMKDGEKEQVIDYDTGETYEQLKDGQRANYDAYAKFFDESNPNWEKNPEHNRRWLHHKEDFANFLLNQHGYLFLNDVYDLLEIPKTQAGQIMGWKKYKDAEEARFHGAANKVLFGILDGDTQASRDFVNGTERSILLKFNVDPEPIIDCVGFGEV